MPKPNPYDITQRLLDHDSRYKIDAYQFVREALAYAQEDMQLGSPDSPEGESHITGQQLCDAIREYGIEQYGYMTKIVLNSWGVSTTRDFGEVVFNLIAVGLMKKSDSDRLEDFVDYYDFDEVFQRRFEITRPD